MYDFYYGEKEKIKKNPEDFLIFCKRLLPRWINGIPDSECLAIYRTLSLLDKTKPVILETGCGASTLAFFLFSVLHNGKIFSWDINSSKGSFLKSFILESMCGPLEIDLFKYWTFIGFDSLDEHVGISVVKELNYKADFCFFDSWHTLDHLMQEVQCFEKIANDDFIIALDDAYYSKRYKNFSYINMIRNKLGLNKITEPNTNICDPFYIEIERYLHTKYNIIVKIDDSYKKEYKDDIFFDYFESDRKAMASVGMEEKDLLEHRYDCWKVKR